MQFIRIVFFYVVFSFSLYAFTFIRRVTFTVQECSLKNDRTILLEKIIKISACAFLLQSLAKSN